MKSKTAAGTCANSTGPSWRRRSVTASRLTVAPCADSIWTVRGVASFAASARAVSGVT